MMGATKLSMRRYRENSGNKALETRIAREDSKVGSMMRASKLSMRRDRENSGNKTLETRTAREDSKVPASVDDRCQATPYGAAPFCKALRRVHPMVDPES
jgi:hypothetical protein